MPRDYHAAGLRSDRQAMRIGRLREGTQPGTAMSDYAYEAGCDDLSGRRWLVRGRLPGDSGLCNARADRGRSTRQHNRSDSRMLGGSPRRGHATDDRHSRSRNSGSCLDCREFPVRPRFAPSSAPVGNSTANTEVTLSFCARASRSRSPSRFTANSARDYSRTRSTSRASRLRSSLTSCAKPRNP